MFFTVGVTIFKGNAELKLLGVLGVIGAIGVIGSCSGAETLLPLLPPLSLIKASTLPSTQKNA